MIGPPNPLKKQSPFPLILALVVVGLLVAGMAFRSLIRPPREPARRAPTPAPAGKISDPDAQVVLGPYPEEADLRFLSQNKIDTIISLLDPRLPYEKRLLDQELQAASEHGLKVLNTPMSSLQAEESGKAYRVAAERAAAATRQAVAHLGHSRVYVHSYLGIDRVQAVAELLRPLGIARYVHKARRPDVSRQIEHAALEYTTGHFQGCLDILKSLGTLDVPGRMLQAQAYYRLGQFGRAREIFAAIARDDIANVGALVGLGNCALRTNDAESADDSFETALKLKPQDGDALTGMGLLRYRQHQPQEAKRYLTMALQVSPTNADARAALRRIGSAPPGVVH